MILLTRRDGTKNFRMGRKIWDGTDGMKKGSLLTLLLPVKLPEFIDFGYFYWLMFVRLVLDNGTTRNRFV